MAWTWGIKNISFTLFSLGRKIAPPAFYGLEHWDLNTTLAFLRPGRGGSKISLSTFMPWRTETKNRTFAFSWSRRNDQTYQFQPFMAQKMVITNGIFAFVWPGRGRSNIARSILYGPEEGERKYHFHSFMAWKWGSKKVLSTFSVPEESD